MTNLVLKSSTSHRGWMDTDLGRFLVCIHGGMSDGQTIAARYDRLSRMSRLELAQQGLTRGDISRAAVNGF
jgi:hypothetical protein